MNLKKLQLIIFEDSYLGELLIHGCFKDKTYKDLGQVWTTCVYANLGESFILLIQCKEAKSNRFDENVLYKK